jgi:hypothetical protein
VVGVTSQVPHRVRAAQRVADAGFWAAATALVLSCFWTGAGWWIRAVLLVATLSHLAVAASLHDIDQPLR